MIHINERKHVLHFRWKWRADNAHTKNRTDRRVMERRQFWLRHFNLNGKANGGGRQKNTQVKHWEI